MPNEPTPTPDPVPAPEPVVNDPPTLLGGNDPPPDPALEPDDPPEGDWRDKIAKVVGDDPKYRAWLNRFTTEENYHKAVPKLRRDFSAGKALVQSGPPEDATPEEIAAYRKAAGVPAKPEEYALAYPDGAKPSEADVAALNGFAEAAHGLNLRPEQVKGLFDWYTKQGGQLSEARGAAADEAKVNNLAELRSEWKGREFIRNTTLAKEFIGKHAEGMEDQIERVLTARIQVGDAGATVALGDFAPFVKFIANAARTYADEEALIGGDGGGGGKSLDDEYKELIDKSASQRLSAGENKRLHELAEARHAREARQGRSRAA